MVTIFDLRPGTTVRGHNFFEVFGKNNDRLVIACNGSTVEYDDDTVGVEETFPIVLVEDFLAWAKELVE